MSNACYLQAHVTVLCSKWDTYCKPNSLNHSGNFMYRLLDQYKNSAGCQHTVNTCPIMATADSGSNTPAFIIETTTSTKWHLQNICIAFRPFSTARQISPPPSGPTPPLWVSPIILRHTKFDRTPLDEQSALRRDLYLHNTRDMYRNQWRDSNPQPQQARWTQTYDSHRAATGIGPVTLTL